MSEESRAKQLAEQTARQAAAIASGKSHGDYQVVNSAGEVIGPKPVLWNSVSTGNALHIESAQDPSAAK